MPPYNLSRLPPPPPPPSRPGVITLDDDQLMNTFAFVKEVGSGNWGSVWLCRKRSTVEGSKYSRGGTIVASKVVHREKTPTTAARLRSLWNEMKCLQALGGETHPNIISFYSFIISQSFALITMPFYSHLIPVEVAEHHSKAWFRSLLSAIDFLHQRGVVHNDIKPANIMLTDDMVPVLIDFGFAEYYDSSKDDAFISNLAYGTPEYLSPERARGLRHDTRKSDVWSLGVTFFEVLIGRTPFEYLENERLTTKEQLERYWGRSIRGSWVGSWKMTTGIEKLLRRMVTPNADLRCTASAAMKDPYWTQSRAEDAQISTNRSAHSHKKSASISHAPTVADALKMKGATASWSSRSNKENLPDSRASSRTRIPVATANLEKEKSQPSSVLGRFNASRHARSQSQSQAEDRTVSDHGVPQHRRQGGFLGMLSPMRYSPAEILKSQASPSPSLRANDKENVSRQTSSASLRATAVRNAATRKPLGPRQPTPPSSPAHKVKKVHADKENAGANEEKERHRKSRVLTERPKNVLQDKENLSANLSYSMRQDDSRETSQGSARVRMLDWERERQRLREMQMVEEQKREESEAEERHEKELEDEFMRDLAQQRALEVFLDRQREREFELERARLREAERQWQRERQRERDQELEKEREELERQRIRDVEMYHGCPRISIRHGSGSTPDSSLPPVPLSPLIEENSYELEPRSPSESSFNFLKHSLKLSLDATKRLYKSSTAALGLDSLRLSVNDVAQRDDLSRRSISSKASWEDEVLLRQAREEQIDAEKQLDRMTIWVRNVEKVVEDARQNFAVSAAHTPLPPLPVAPIARPSPSDRSNRSNRVPRKILAANQIFVDEYDSSRLDDSLGSSVNSSQPGGIHTTQLKSMFDDSLPVIPSEGPTRMSIAQQEVDVPGTPQRNRRRATIVTRSPEAPKRKPSLELDISPTKHKEKSKSQHDLGRPITPVTRLEFELQQLDKPVKPAPIPRLSSLIDKTLFIAEANSMYKNNAIENRHDEMEEADVTSSPLHVEPYPPRPPPKSAMTIDTPARHRMEGVYDRFLMSTTGVKRVGRGYQSDNKGPMSHIPQPKASYSKRNPNFFLSARRTPLPPPVSSEDLRRSVDVDEFGAMSCAPVGQTFGHKDENSHPVGLVRRAIKAMTVKR